ncbi:hypothetical protein AALA00_07080 [Lachnospiraceae bacterium 46-15]
MLIADECHHYGSGQNSLIFEFLPYIEPYRENFFSMGLSATLPAGEKLLGVYEEDGEFEGKNGGWMK